MKPVSYTHLDVYKRQDYGAVKKAVDIAYEKASALIEVFGQKPASILHFTQNPDL